MRAIIVLVVLAFVAVPLAGCFNKDTTPPSYTVKAGSGKASAGWAYDGLSVTGGDATLDGFVVNAENTGALFANFTYLGSKYLVVFDQFKQAEGKAFQDGGIAFDLTEHGDSGTADTSIPKVHTKIAAYGTASVMRDGSPVKGKAGDRWNAHLMVYDDAVRGADGKITKADGTTPYDPSAAGDAKTYPGMPQAMLKLVSPDGENATRAAVTTNKNVTLNGPNSMGDVDIPVEAGALPFTITVNSTDAAPMNPGVPAVGAAQVTITVKAGNKTYSDGPVNVVPGTPYSHAFPLKAEDLAAATGPIKVSISGNGVTTLNVIATVAYADHPFIVLTWDNPTLT